MLRGKDTTKGLLYVPYFFGKRKRSVKKRHVLHSRSRPPKEQVTASYLSQRWGPRLLRRAWRRPEKRKGRNQFSTTPESRFSQLRLCSADNQPRTFGHVRCPLKRQSL